MRAFLVALALASAATVRPAHAAEPEPALRPILGSWAVISAPGVFGLSRRLTIEGNRIVRPDAPFPTFIGEVATSGDWVAIRFVGRSGMLLRRETPDRLCGWGAPGPMTDMRTALNREDPPFCMVRLRAQPPE